MAALAALYPAKLQKVASFDRFGHYRLETGEQLLVWTPIYPAGPLPLIIYLHGASSRGEDIQEIFEKGPGCPPALLRAGDIAPRAVVVAPLLAAKREWCKTSREAATTLKIIDAYFAEEARGVLAAVDRSRVYVTGPSCGGLGAYTLAARLARRGDGFSDRCPPAAAVVPVCGGGNVVFAPLLAKTPCWFWHSESDSAVPCCVEINQCVGCTRQFFTKSFLGDDAALLARSSGEEPASPRHRAGVVSMAWRTTQ